MSTRSTTDDGSDDSTLSLSSPPEAPRSYTYIVFRLCSGIAIHIGSLTALLCGIPCLGSALEIFSAGLILFPAITRDILHPDAQTVFSEYILPLLVCLSHAPLIWAVGTGSPFIISFLFTPYHWPYMWRASAAVVAFSVGMTLGAILSYCWLAVLYMRGTLPEDIKRLIGDRRKPREDDSEDADIDGAESDVVGELIQAQDMPGW